MPPSCPGKSGPSGLPVFASQTRSRFSVVVATRVPSLDHCTPPLSARPTSSFRSSLPVPTSRRMMDMSAMAGDGTPENPVATVRPSGLNENQPNGPPRPRGRVGRPVATSNPLGGVPPKGMMYTTFPSGPNWRSEYARRSPG